MKNIRTTKKSGDIIFLVCCLRKCSDTNSQWNSRKALFCPLYCFLCFFIFILLCCTILVDHCFRLLAHSFSAWGPVIADSVLLRILQCWVVTCNNQPMRIMLILYCCLLLKAIINFVTWTTHKWKVMEFPFGTHILYVKLWHNYLNKQLLSFVLQEIQFLQT